MKNVLIIGAGGHGQVVADIFLAVLKSNKLDIKLFFLDDDKELKGEQILGIDVLGSVGEVTNYQNYKAILAIGDNTVRSELYHKIKNNIHSFINAIHPKSSISADVGLGEGIMCCAGAIVNTGSKIGSNVILNTGCTVDHHNVIADHVHIAPGVHLGGNVKVGDGTLIGIGSTVIPGIEIGKWSVIGAGSVVTKNIPPFSTAFGVPARVIKHHKK